MGTLMKKFKLLASIFVMLLVFGVIAMSLYFALSPKNKILNNIKFFPNDSPSFTVECVATWLENEDPTRKTIIFTNEEGVLSATSWNAPDIDFNRVINEEVKELVMEFTFTNTSETNDTMNVTFEGICSDSKDDSYMNGNERFVAEVRKNRTGLRRLLTKQVDNIDEQFLLQPDETVTIEIFYTLKKWDTSFSENQNIIINVGLNDA